MWSKLSVFADTSVGCKILVHVADDEIDTIPDYGEVFSSDDEDEDDPGIFFKILNFWSTIVSITS